MRTHAGRLALGVLLSFLLPAQVPAASPETEAAADLAAAHALFERNLQAIRERDRDAYLACYLQSPGLVRTGPQGPALGYDEFAEGAGDGWPELFEARDLQLVPVRPGVVYGTYRYRIVQDGTPSAGISERVFLKTPEGFRIAVTTAFPAAPGVPPPPLALTGATLIDGKGGPPVPDSVVVIRGGRIDCAGTRDRCEIPDGVEILDITGEFLAPGLIDSHVHFSQTGWVDGRPDSVDVRDRYPYNEVAAGLRAHPERFYRAYLCSGVTAVLDVGGYPWTWGLRGAAEDDTWAPHVEASGPLLSTIDFWLNLPAERQFMFMADEATVRDAVAYLASSGTRVAKLWYIPASDRGTELVSSLVQLAGSEVHNRGMRLAVHATGLVQAKEAVRAGADLLVHSVTDQEVDDEFIELALRQGTILTPTLTVYEGYVDAYAGVLREDRYPLDCVGPHSLGRARETGRLHPDGADPARVERIRTRSSRALTTGSSNLLRLHRAGIPIAMGTDAGNPLTLHGPSVHAEMLAMQEAGLTPMSVLVAATRDAARAMGRADDLGTVEAGKIADMVVVESDPTLDTRNLRRLTRVIRAGVVHLHADLLPPATAP